MDVTKKLGKESSTRGCALMSSDHSNRCYAAILIGNIDGFQWDLSTSASNSSC